MSVLLICFGSAVVAGVLTAAAARRWWRTDPGAPRVEPSTIASGVRRHQRVARWMRSAVDPQAAAGTVIVAAAIVAVVGGGALGVVLAMVRTHRGFADFDTSAARYGATHATPSSTHVMRIVTQFGGAYVLVPLVVVIG